VGGHREGSGVTAGARFLTLWVTVPACVWNEHELDTAPEGCEWVLLGVSIEYGTCRELARMGFALTPELLEEHTLDSFIDAVALPEIFAAVDRVRPLGDLIVNQTTRLDAGHPWR
jgi:hypothetical protein